MPPRPLARAALSELEDGTWTFEDQMDSCGPEPDQQRPARIVLTLTIAGDEAAPWDLKAIRAEFPTVAVVNRHFPLNAHPFAVPAAGCLAVVAGFFGTGFFAERAEDAARVGDRHRDRRGRPREVLARRVVARRVQARRDTERHAAERRCCGIKGYERGCRCEVCVAAKAWSNGRQRLQQKRGRDLHPGERLCRPSPNYSATAPGLETYTNPENDMTVIAILRADHPTHTPRVEGAELRLAGAQVRITTDDGTTIEFDREEMLAFLAPATDQPFWAGLRKAA